MSDTEEPEELKLPWEVRTRQREGMSSEKRRAKKDGARLHPRSGAGSIKWDASNDDEIFEYKDVAKSHTLKGELLEALFRDAMQQGKKPVYIVTFKNHNIIVECTIKREIL